LIVTGDLHPAASDEDRAIQLSLADAAGMESEAARFMLLDQRTEKPRRTRYKLIIDGLAISES
jgi:hypothetical protein